MEKQDIKIVELEPMRVVSAHGFGASPEGLAWDKLMGYVRAQGLVGEVKQHRFFGFNNPNPSAGSPNYGYEQWMTVGPDAPVTGDVKIVEFSGGRYAVAHCKGPWNLPQAWQDLVTAVEASGHQPGPGQCLEEVVNPEILNETPVNYDNLEFEIYEPLLS